MALHCTTAFPTVSAGAARPRRAARGALPRLAVLAGLAALMAVPGCTRTRRELLLIAPVTMSTTASEHNYPENDAYVMVENATLGAQVRFHSVQRWGLRITARGVPAANGRWPELRVEIDGQPPRLIIVSGRGRSQYALDFAAEPGVAEVKLSLQNGEPFGSGPRLVIEQVAILPA